MSFSSLLSALAVELEARQRTATTSAADVIMASSHHHHQEQVIDIDEHNNNNSSNPNINSNGEEDDDEEEEYDDDDEGSDSSDDYGSSGNRKSSTASRKGGPKAARRYSVASVSGLTTMTRKTPGSAATTPPHPQRRTSSFTSLTSLPKAEDTTSSPLGLSVSEELINHNCEVRGCTAVFQSQEHLKRHMRKHTGEKPFACLFPGCCKTFSRNDNMLQHLRTHAKVIKGKIARGPTGRLVPSSIATIIRETMLNSPQDSNSPSPPPAQVRRSSLSLSRRPASRSSSPAVSSPSSALETSPTPVAPALTSAPASVILTPPILYESKYQQDLALERPPFRVFAQLDSHGLLQFPMQAATTTATLGYADPPTCRQMVPFPELYSSAQSFRKPGVIDTDRALLDRLRGPF